MIFYLVFCAGDILDYNFSKNINTRAERERNRAFSDIYKNPELLNQRSQLGENLIHCAVSKYDYIFLRRFLKEYPDKIDMFSAVDNNGRTPLHIAAAKSMYTMPAIECINIISQISGVDMNALDKSGKTPLMSARKLSIIEKLLTLGADPCIRTHNKSSIFHNANIQIIQILQRYMSRERLIEELKTPNHDGVKPITWLLDREKDKISVFFETLGLKMEELLSGEEIYSLQEALGRKFIEKNEELETQFYTERENLERVLFEEPLSKNKMLKNIMALCGHYDPGLKFDADNTAVINDGDLPIKLSIGNALSLSAVLMPKLPEKSSIKLEILKKIMDGDNYISLSNTGEVIFSTHMLVCENINPMALRNVIAAFKEQFNILKNDFEHMARGINLGRPKRIRLDLYINDSIEPQDILDKKSEMINRIVKYLSEKSTLKLIKKENNMLIFNQNGDRGIYILFPEGSHDIMFGSKISYHGRPVPNVDFLKIKLYEQLLQLNLPFSMFGLNCTITSDGCILLYWDISAINAPVNLLEKNYKTFEENIIKIFQLLGEVYNTQYPTIEAEPGQVRQNIEQQRLQFEANKTNLESTLKKDIDIQANLGSFKIINQKINDDGKLEIILSKGSLDGLQENMKICIVQNNQHIGTGDVKKVSAEEAVGIFDTDKILEGNLDSITITAVPFDVDIAVISSSYQRAPFRKTPLWFPKSQMTEDQAKDRLPNLMDRLGQSSFKLDELGSELRDFVLYEIGMKLGIENLLSLEGIIDACLAFENDIKRVQFLESALNMISDGQFIEKCKEKKESVVSFRVGQDQVTLPAVSSEVVENIKNNLSKYNFNLLKSGVSESFKNVQCIVSHQRDEENLAQVILDGRNRVAKIIGAQPNDIISMRPYIEEGPDIRCLSHFYCFSDLNSECSPETGKVVITENNKKNEYGRVYDSNEVEYSSIPQHFKLILFSKNEGINFDVNIYGKENQ